MVTVGRRHLGLLLSNYPLAVVSSNTYKLC